jgi:hypothetical protein
MATGAIQLVRQDGGLAFAAGAPGAAASGSRAPSLMNAHPIAIVAAEPVFLFRTDCTAWPVSIMRTRNLARALHEVALLA